MRAPTRTDAFQVLLLQAADEGRGPVLFGESLQRAREAVPPFLVGVGRVPRVPPEILSMTLLVASSKVPPA